MFIDVWVYSNIYNLEFINYLGLVVAQLLFVYRYALSIGVLINHTVHIFIFKVLPKTLLKAVIIDAIMQYQLTNLRVM